jgi:GNAT superfamily N-acetyltransferase
MDLEFRTAGLDDPDAIRLASEMSDELIAREAHADPDAAEHKAPMADAVGPDGELILAYDGGDAVAIGALRPLDGGVGEIKWMYVMPAYRGAGVARRLLEELEQRGRARGFETVRLDTHDRLGEANRLYRGAGYREIPDYNGNPSANRWFEKSLA